MNLWPPNLDGITIAAGECDSPATKSNLARFLREIACFRRFDSQLSGEDSRDDPEENTKDTEGEQQANKAESAGLVVTVHQHGRVIEESWMERHPVVPSWVEPIAAISSAVIANPIAVIVVTATVAVEAGSVI